MMNIIDFIPKGHENALTRRELVELTGIDDRTIRNAISNSDELIINLQDGKGYFKPLPTEDSLVREWIMMFNSRVNDEIRRIACASDWLKDNAS